MIRSRKQQSENVLDGLVVGGSIFPLQGSNSQIYYGATEEWESDRRYVPCILFGAVNTSDPSDVMNGEQALTGIEWYTDVPTGDLLTYRIKNPAADILSATDSQGAPAAWRSIDYLISDGSNDPWCAGVPEWGLIVHKNVPHNTTMQLFAVLKFIDKRTGVTVRKVASIGFATEYFDNVSLRVEGNRPEDWVMDPIAAPEPLASGHDILDEPWTRTFAAQLKRGDNDVPDAEACYLWVVKDTTEALGWRRMTSDERNLLGISSDTVKQISLDTRIVMDGISLRCYAKLRPSAAAWSSPLGSSNPFWECRMTMKMSDNMSVVTKQTAGFDQDTKMDKTCRYTAEILYNNKPVPANKYGLFRIIWIGTNMSNGALLTVGEGRTCQFVPKKFGFTFPAGFAVHAEAYVLKTCAIVTDDSDSNCIIVDDTNQNEVIIDGVYE